MNAIVDVIIYLFIFGFGLVIGFFVKEWLIRRSKYGGTIYITHSEEKTLYSLELSDYPETLEFKKVVVFKVDASNRENLPLL